MAEIRFDKARKVYPNGTVGLEGLDLAIRDSEFFCLLGPSGCGKSSTLRMLAGVEDITSGRILVDDVVVNNVPAERRDMAMVFENYALYPHLTVFDNIAMPLAARRIERAEIRRKVENVADILAIRELLGKMTPLLSGGQKQRVAIGRALVRNPRVFLLDEPLGHLEAYMRGRLRAEIRTLQESMQVTTVLITHDQDEAAALADRIAVMRAGTLQQVGTFAELYERPCNRFVAEFIGSTPTNFFPSRHYPEANTVVLDATSGPVRIALGDRGQPQARDPLGAIELSVRPEDLRLRDEAAPDRLGGTVVSVEPMGEVCGVVVETDGIGLFRCFVTSARRPRVGQTVHCEVDIARAAFFDAEGRNLGL